MIQAWSPVCCRAVARYHKAMHYCSPVHFYKTRLLLKTAWALKVNASYSAVAAGVNHYIVKKSKMILAGVPAEGVW